MSNKVLKDANNQLINIDSSNLSSFDEGIVHKTGNESISGIKAFSKISFSNTIVSTYNSWIFEDLKNLTFRTRKGDYDITQGNVVVSIPTLENPTAQNVNINFPTTGGTLATTDDISNAISNTYSYDTTTGILTINLD